MTLSRIITTTITGLLTSALILSGITTSTETILQNKFNNDQLYTFTAGITQYTNDATRAIQFSNTILAKSEKKWDECKDNFNKADNEKDTINKDKLINIATKACREGSKIQERFDNSVCEVSGSLSKIEGLIMDIENMPNNKQPRANAQKKLKDLYSKTSDLYNKLQQNFATKKNNFDNLKLKYFQSLKSIPLYTIKFCSRSPEFLKRMVREGKIKPTSRVSNARNNNSTIARTIKTNSRIIS